MNYSEKKTKPRRGVFILPNTITSIALFCGFYGIVKSLSGDFLSASIAIFIAMLFDGLDGRLARLTKSTTAFGAEYDSLSDMVSFGAAPAIIMYQWALADLGKWGLVAAFIYCVSGALRLARFNVNIEVVDKRFFQGLPSPSAAAITMGIIWLSESHALNLHSFAWVFFALTCYAGLMMISNIPLYSFKTLGYKKSVPFLPFLLVILTLIIIFIDPPIAIFSLFFIYSLSGYIIWLFQKGKKKQPNNSAA